MSKNILERSILMTKKEFNKGVKEYSEIAVENANKLLSKLGKTLSIDWNYEFEGDLEGAIGAYEAWSGFDGDMRIAFNMKNLYRYMVQAIKENPWTDPYTMLSELIFTNVYHEMGHGLVEMIDDYLHETDELDALYDANQELFDEVLDNEEDSVEEFAWCFYDNELENSSLWEIIELYMSLCENNNNVREIRMNDKRIKDIIRESIASKLNESDAVDFFNGLNKANGGLTPWDSETKMERMHPGNAARANYIPSKGNFKLHSYQDWVKNYKSKGISYSDYMKIKL